MITINSEYLHISLGRTLYLQHRGFIKKKLSLATELSDYA